MFLEKPDTDCLILLWPLMNFAFLYKITESAPVKLAQGHGTPEFYFMVTDTDYLPIAPARPLLYVDLLPHLKRVGAKH